MDIKEVSVKGHAKINLHLDVVGKLDNGFHSITTVMQSVSLADEIILTCNEKQRFDVECDTENVPSGDANIAVRAVKLFLDHIKESRLGVDIKINKNIPMAAGLAGGSADAAATLVGMNRLFDDCLCKEKLCELGAYLGSDVPFCIVGGTVLAEGRGEILTDFAPMPNIDILIACEGEGVSTPWAYRLLDNIYNDFDSESAYRPKSIDALRCAMEKTDVIGMCESMYNIFEEPVLNERPVAAQIRDMMKHNGALRAMMSGSGPSIFGVFDSEDTLAAAERAIADHGWRSYRCRPIRSLL